MNQAFVSSEVIPALDLTSTEEQCVGANCHKFLGYPKSLHIDHPKRMGNYVEACGQLCIGCSSKIFPSKFACIPVTLDS